METRQQLHIYWEELCLGIQVPKDLEDSIWGILEEHYSEPTRHFHTLMHLLDMLNKRHALQELIEDQISVDLAIWFHDVVYNPRSITNEEDSCQLFKETFQPLQLSRVNSEKIVHYILMTKEHNVRDCGDNDLKLFIDIDMSVLGSPQNRLSSTESDIVDHGRVHIPSLFSYSEYAHMIRLEYCHIDEVIYCKSRAAFLRMTLDTVKSTMEGKDGDLTQRPIFASDFGLLHWESQAKENLLWEIELLDCCQIP